MEITMKTLTSIYMIILFMTLTIGCSKSVNSPIMPDETLSITDLPTIELQQGEPSRHLLGIWDFIFNLETQTVHVIPNRQLMAHEKINISKTAPQISNYLFNPLTGIVDVDVSLKNPENDIDYHDYRFIVYTNNNIRILLNFDDWTALWDIPGGTTLNPFIAYAKREPNRKFPGNARFKEHCQFYMPTGSGTVTAAVDVSNDGNCLEPYEITDFKLLEPLYDTINLSAEAEVKVLDWQNDVNKVYIYCGAVMGSDWGSFTNVGNNKWRLDVINRMGASAGNYIGVIQARSAGTTVALYDVVTIYVSEVLCPIDNNDTSITAEPVAYSDTINGCTNINDPDWYSFYITPKGFTSDSFLELTTFNSRVDIYVYGTDDTGHIPPGSLIKSELNTGSKTLYFDQSSFSKIYIMVVGKDGTDDYQLVLSFIPVLSKINCEVYVATDDGTPTGHWPIWEEPDPDVELTLTHLNDLLAWGNGIWQKYGYELVWDGSVSIMAAQYYTLDDHNEESQMHITYGQSNNILSLYFVDDFYSDVKTAYCNPDPDKTKSTYKNVYSVYHPNIWLRERVIAHEHGHILGYLFDQYQYDIQGCPCGDIDCLDDNTPGLFLYHDPNACYDENLMWSVSWLTWDQYTLTLEGQVQNANKFHFEYPENFSFY